MNTSAKPMLKYHYNNANREEEAPEKPDDIMACKTVS